MKKCIIILLAILLTFSLCACGSKTFTVESVGFDRRRGNAPMGNSQKIGFQDYAPCTDNLMLIGQYQGKEVELYVNNALKDSTFVSFDLENEKDYEYYETDEYQKSLSTIYRFEGGAVLTTEDADRTIHTLTVKRDSKFDVDDSDGNIKLILPKE